jgi:hypothetical protein
VPLKLMDYINRGKASAIDGAAVVFFFGSKRTAAIPGREIISLYRGGL